MARTHWRFDLSPWVRGPSTGVGQCAYCSYKAVVDLFSEEQRKTVTAVSRDYKNKQTDDYFWMNPWTRFWGGMDSLYLSFDQSLPPLITAKKALVIHDCWTLRRNNFQSSEFQQYQKKKILKSVERADVIFCPTQYVADELSYSYSQNAMVEVLPWAPVIDPKFKTTDVKIPDRPYLLMVGTFEIRKNQDFLLKAMRFLKEDYALVLVGGAGFGSNAIQKNIREAQKDEIEISVHENLSHGELAGLYENSFAVALPSFEEGFGLPAVEALQFKKPLLLSAIAAFREVADEAALYFDPYFGKMDFVKHIRSLEDQEFYDDMSVKSELRSMEFSWKKTAAKLIKSLGQL